MATPRKLEPKLFRPTPYPDNLPPLVALLFSEANRQKISLPKLAARAGVDHKTIHNWKRKHRPQLPTIEACLNALGFELACFPKAGKKEHSAR